MRVESGLLQAVSLAGDVSAAGWLKAYLETAESVTPLGRRLMMPSATPPAGFVSRGRIVCNCFDVAERDIHAVLREQPADPEGQLAKLQSRLKCGNNCGSCIPELRAMIKQVSISTTPA